MSTQESAPISGWQSPEPGAVLVAAGAWGRQQHAHQPLSWNEAALPPKGTQRQDMFKSKEDMGSIWSAPLISR